MKTRIIYTTALLFAFFLASCKNNDANNLAYFGGKIINPKTKFVVLYTMDKLVDTLFLDDRNKFMGVYKDINEGLYYFQHGNENQYVYIEPNDSLMVRLNTWNFDESIVFSGRGAERNNILIDIFLEDEKDKNFYYVLSKLSPELYKQKIDSILKQKLKTYEEYVALHPLETSNYFKILNVALTYPVYSRVERYYKTYKDYSNLETLPTLHESFYSFRDKIDVNNDTLMYYTPYATYIRNYLYNSAYNKNVYKNDSLAETNFTVDLLQTINSKIRVNSSKNAFLKSTLLDHFYNKSSCNINRDAFETFFEFSTNTKDKELIKNLLRDSEKISRGDRIAGFAIHDFTNQPFKIEDFTKNKNSVLFFWNKEYASKIAVGSRISYLQKRYPSLNFAVIEIDGGNSTSNRIENIDIKNQFYITKDNAANNFLSCKMPRTILINKKGIVTNGFASISSKKIYFQLEELQNK